MKTFFTILIFLAFSVRCLSQVTELTGEECKIIFDSIYEKCRHKKAFKEILQVCLANPNNETSLMQLYRLKNRINKETLQDTYDRLNSGSKTNPYAKSLHLFINTPQIKKGDSYFDFIAKTSDNENFILSQILKDKSVLLIFGGLSCMGRESRQELREIYSKLDLSKVEIVSFINLTNEKELKTKIEEYNVSWIAISDFKGLLSEPWLAYVDKGTPTTVFIDSNGKVLVKRPGLTNKAMKLLRKNKNAL